LEYQVVIRLEEGFTIAEKTATLTDHEMHAHDALEIGIVVDNQIRYKTPQRDYYGHPGDIFLYRPFEPHWTLIDEGKPPARWIMLLFLPSFAGSLPDGHKLLTPFYSMRTMPLIPASSEHAPAIRAAAEAALREQQEQRYGWQTRRFLHFADALVLIRRHYAETAETAEDRSAAGLDGAIDSRLERIIQSMLGRFADEPEMDALIRQSGLGKSRFFQKFKKMTGLSPGQFLIRLRLQHAAYLLKHSDKLITEIAYECGFRSVSYFNRQFKKFDGRSPGEHRRRFSAGGQDPRR
jgi:AraC-like DNA-binding protein